MPRMAINSESRVSLLYRNSVAAMRDIGNMTSKKRGRARHVRIQNVPPEDPAFITISKKRRDCVRKIIKVRTTAMKAVV